MKLNDIIVDITSAPILNIDEEIDQIIKREQEYNWSYDANGSPIESDEDLEYDENYDYEINGRSWCIK